MRSFPPPFQLVWRKYERVSVLLPYAEGRLVSMFHEKGHVRSLEHKENGVRIQGLLPVQLLAFFENYLD